MLAAGQPKLPAVTLGFYRLLFEELDNAADARPLPHERQRDCYLGAVSKSHCLLKAHITAKLHPGNIVAG